MAATPLPPDFSASLRLLNEHDVMGTKLEQLQIRVAPDRKEALKRTHES